MPSSNSGLSIDVLIRLNLRLFCLICWSLISSTLSSSSSLTSNKFCCSPSLTWEFGRHYCSLLYFLFRKLLNFGISHWFWLFSFDRPGRNVKEFRVLVNWLLLTNFFFLDFTKKALELSWFSEDLELLLYEFSYDKLNLISI